MFGLTLGQENDKMQEQEVIVLKKQMDTLSPEDLKVLADDKSSQIFQKISNIGKYIDEAKLITEEAKDSGGFFRNVGNLITIGIVDSASEKRGKLNTEAISAQNMALIEMNGLLQESIRLMVASYSFASALLLSMDEKRKKGFKDIHGNLRQLSDNEKKIVQTMMKDVENFVRYHQEYEKRQEKQEEDIENLKSTLQEKKAKIKEMEQSFDTHKGEYEARQKEQEEDIGNLHSKLKSKDELDDKQSKDIEALKAELATKGGSLSLITSVIALLGAVASIALQFLR